MAAKGLERFRSLSDEESPRRNEDGQFLLLSRLNRYARYIRLGRCYGDRVGVCSVCFVPFDKGFYLLSGEDCCLVAQRTNLSRPKVAGAPGFHSNGARRKVLKESLYILPTQLFVECLCAVGVDPMHLKYIFCQIEADYNCVFQNKLPRLNEGAK